MVLYSLTKREKLRAFYRAWRYRLIVERLEISFVVRYLQPGQTVVDVGAHKGAFTYWMQRVVGCEGRVFSFEPQPELAHYLQQLNIAFGLHHVTIVNSALSSSVGVVELVRPQGGPWPEATVKHDCDSTEERLSVAADTLDNYFSTSDRRPIHFIKCDVEGHEFDVFRGGHEILCEDRPVLLFESEIRHQGNRRVETTFDYLKDLGYQGYFFSRSPRCIQPLVNLNPAKHFAQPWSKYYVRNFVFLPQGANTS